MKDKAIKIAFLIAIFLLFICAKFLNYQENDYKILKFNSPDEVYIDFNNNNIPEKRELVKFSNVKVFSSIKHKNQQSEIDSLKMTNFDFLKLGLLSEAWFDENIVGQKVTVKVLQTIPYKKVEIRYNEQDLEKYLLENGYAYIVKNSKFSLFQNYSKIKENITQLNKLKYYVLNLKSNIYHKPDCKYAKNISNAQLFLENKLDKTRYFPCKNCLGGISLEHKKFSYIIPKNINTYSKSLYKKYGKIEFFLINPYENKKPNKNAKNVLTNRLIEEINNATESIDIALYSFVEQENILKFLIDAKNRGVSIRFVLDKSKNVSDNETLFNVIQNNFPVVFDDDNSLMHNKFFIFDNKKVFTGSTNVSSTGIGGYNANISIIIDSIEISKLYSQEFEQMFSGKFSKNKNRIETKEIILNDTILTPYFSPKSDILEDVLIPLIKNAQKEIIISAFYLTDRKLIGELINAQNRNVRVLILLDSLGVSNLPDRVVLLRNSGIPVKVENWGGKNHEKTILIDNSKLLIGSCNFSYAGFYKNDENILVIENPELLKVYRDYYLYLFNKIEDEYLYKVPKAESLESVNSCFDGIDNDYDGKIDNNDENCVLKRK